ncbi:MAG: hemolysin III family protein [Actinobacteria bacterium]|nr:hemolysin III family protein [Actinomycetota bacterium]
MKSAVVEAPVPPPKLRGWFHLGAAPVVFVASLVLFILSERSLKFAVALYSITAITLFSVSAVYHRVPWSPSKKKIWRRWDHANINLLIAGSYTPYAVTLLNRHDRTIMLSVVWTGALIGVALRIFWLSAPRWLYVANYLALGWVAVIYTPQMYRSGGLAILLPILIGGLFYSVGAIFYALKRPGRYARYFGFHELFHIFVIAAWVSQYIGVSIAIYRH